MKFKLKQTYLYKLHTLTNSLDKAFDQVLKERCSIGLAQFMLLLMVKQLNSPSQRELAFELEQTPGAISRQVEVCKSRGWLKVKENPQDRREQYIVLTNAGNNNLTTSLKALEKYLLTIFDSSDGRMTLMAHIDALQSNIASVTQGNFKVRKESTMAQQFPKAKQLFRGDINDAVIRVQKATGVEVTPSWWNANVGNDGSAEQILERFDNAYAKLMAEKTKQK